MTRIVTFKPILDRKTIGKQKMVYLGWSIFVKRRKIILGALVVLVVLVLVLIGVILILLSKPKDCLKLVKRSIPLGDYVEDTRVPARACSLLTKEVQDSNPGLECSLLCSRRVSAPEDWAECVDGGSIAGCFVCFFGCQ